jgi:hypothetical protein
MCNNNQRVLYKLVVTADDLLSNTDCNQCLIAMHTACLVGCPTKLVTAVAFKLFEPSSLS